MYRYNASFVVSFFGSSFPRTHTEHLQSIECAYKVYEYTSPTGLNTVKGIVRIEMKKDSLQRSQLVIIIIIISIITVVCTVCCIFYG